MLRVLIIVVLASLCVSFKFSSMIHSGALKRSYLLQQTLSPRIAFLDSSSVLLSNDDPQIAAMKEFAVILANVTDHLQYHADVSFKILTEKAQFLMNKDIAKLAQEMLSTYPKLREDEMLARGYMFMSDFIEGFATQTTMSIIKQRFLLNDLINATYTNEATLNKFISENIDELSHSLFTKFLSVELEKFEPDSSEGQMLAIIKLKILEESKKKFGVDELIITELAEIDKVDDMKARANELLKNYTLDDKKRLYSKVLSIVEVMNQEQANNHPLYVNMKEIETILRMMVIIN